MKSLLKWFLIAIVCLAFISYCTSQLSDNDQTSVSTTDNSSISSTPAPVEKPQPKMWQMSSSIDEMTDAENFWAQLRSENYFNFSFPYEGQTYATLAIRYMKRLGGNDVYIKIDRGQIHSTKDQVVVRFDDNPAVTYKYNEPTTSQSDLIFIDRAQDFITRAKKAHEIKIQVPIYDEGEKIYTFKVDSLLVWDHK